MVNGQGTLIGNGSDDKSLMKSMQPINAPGESNSLMKTIPLREAVASASTKPRTMQKIDGEFDQFFAKLDELIEH